MPQPVHNLVVIRCGVAVLCPVGPLSVEGCLLGLPLCLDLNHYPVKATSIHVIGNGFPVGPVGTVVLAISVVGVGLHHIASRKHAVAPGFQRHCLQLPAPIAQPECEVLGMQHVRANS